MDIIIVGGGKVGAALAARLLAARHEHIGIAAHGVDRIEVAMVHRIAVGVKQVQQREIVFGMASHHHLTRTSTPQVRGSA